MVRKWFVSCIVPVMIGRLDALTCEYFLEFSKKFEMTLKLFSRALGKMIHKKNLKKKFCDTVQATRVPGCK
jgi:hypothetical protein